MSLHVYDVARQFTFQSINKSDRRRRERFPQKVGTVESHNEISISSPESLRRRVQQTVLVQFPPPLCLLIFLLENFFFPPSFIAKKFSPSM
jgi:hypothetical protein